jgi:hypothetical protein
MEAQARNEAAPCKPTVFSNHPELIQLLVECDWAKEDRADPGGHEVPSGRPKFHIDNNAKADNRYREMDVASRTGQLEAVLH